MVDALSLSGDEGRSTTAISFGEVSSNLRSGDLRMGKPGRSGGHSLLMVRGVIPGELKHLSTRRKGEQ